MIRINRFVSILVLFAGFFAVRGNSVEVFSAPNAGSYLEFVEAYYDGIGLKAPADLVISPDGKFVYSTNFGSSTITVFEKNDETESLKHVQTVRNSIGGVSGLGGVGEMIIPPNGEQFYYRGPGGSGIFLFNRDPETGWLNFVMRYQNGVNGILGMSNGDSFDISPVSSLIKSYT